MSTELTPEQEKQVQERLQEQENNFADLMTTRMSWVLKIMKEHFGEEAYQVLVKENGEKTRQHWSKVAEEAGDNSIETFIKYQFGENAEYTKTEAGYQFNFTEECAMCKQAKRLGVTEEMFYWVCEPDGFAAEGFNPNIGFKRTKTTMQGDDCCNHLYYYKDKSKQS